MKVNERFESPIIELQIITKHKTGNSLADKGEIIIQFIDMVINDFFIPFDKEFKLSVFGVNNSGKELEYSEKNWNTVKKNLLLKKYDSLTILEQEREYVKTYIDERGQVRNNPSYGMKKTFRLRFDFESWDNKESVTYNKIRFFVSLDLLDLDESQEKWVKLLLDNYIKFDGISALLEISGANRFFGCGTDCEAITQSTNSVSMRERLENNILRGGFWGNIWNEKQVEMLGGIDEIQKAVKIYEIKEIENNNGKHYYLQLTADIFEINYKKQKQLYEFLIKKDVLPKLKPEDHRCKNYLGTYEEYREKLRKGTDFYDIYEEITGEKIGYGESEIEWLDRIRDINPEFVKKVEEIRAELFEREKKLGYLQNTILEEEEQPKVSIEWIEEGHAPDITLEIIVNGKLEDEEIEKELEKIADSWYKLCEFNAFEEGNIHNMSGLSEEYDEDLDKTVFTFDIDLGSASEKSLNVFLSAVKNLIEQYSFKGEGACLSVKY